MAGARHIIRQQVLELFLEGEKDAREIQEEVSQIFQFRMLPKMEALFDRLMPGEEVLKINQLELDLGDIRLDDLQHALPARIEQMLGEQIIQAVHRSRGGPAGQANAQMLEATDSKLVAFEYLLKTGVHPWHSPVKSQDLSSLFDVLLADNSHALRSMLLSETDQAYIRRRLFFQLKESQQEQLIQMLPESGSGPSLYQSLWQGLRKLSTRLAEGSAQAAGFKAIVLDQILRAIRHDQGRSPTPQSRTERVVTNFLTALRSEIQQRLFGAGQTSGTSGSSTSIPDLLQDQSVWVAFGSMAATARQTTETWMAQQAELTHTSPSNMLASAPQSPHTAGKRPQTETARSKEESYPEDMVKKGAAKPGIADIPSESAPPGEATKLGTEFDGTKEAGQTSKQDRPSSVSNNHAPPASDSPNASTDPTEELTREAITTDTTGQATQQPETMQSPDQTEHPSGMPKSGSNDPNKASASPQVNITPPDEQVRGFKETGVQEVSPPSEPRSPEFVHDGKTGQGSENNYVPEEVDSQDGHADVRITSTETTPKAADPLEDRVAGDQYQANRKETKEDHLNQPSGPVDPTTTTSPSDVAHGHDKNGPDKFSDNPQKAETHLPSTDRPPGDSLQNDPPVEKETDVADQPGSEIVPKTASERSANKGRQASGAAENRRQISQSSAAMDPSRADDDQISDQGTTRESSDSIGIGKKVTGQASDLQLSGAEDSVQSSLNEQTEGRQSQNTAARDASAQDQQHEGRPSPQGIPPGANRIVPHPEDGFTAPLWSKPPSIIEEAYINNAGLALLWPYLPILFKGLNWVSEGAFKEEAYQFRAIHLMQYMVTEETATEEQELIFNKLLVGLQAEVPVPFDVALTPEEIDEADHLLQAVMENWKALKSGSVELLRRSFLQKEGVLKKDMASWKLFVERSAFDILLDRLPWSYSVVKLPWMDNLINVEW